MRLSPLLLALPLALVACTAAPVPTPGDSASSSAAVSSAAAASMTEYSDPGIGYSVSYPASWIQVDDKAMTAADYEATGAAFEAPAEATTLTEAYFHVAQTAACPTLSGA